MNKIITWFKNLYVNDPVYNCKLYREQGCSHVDGILCDYPECTMNKEYIENK